MQPAAATTHRSRTAANQNVARRYVTSAWPRDLSIYLSCNELPFLERVSCGALPLPGSRPRICMAAEPPPLAAPKFVGTTMAPTDVKSVEIASGSQRGSQRKRRRKKSVETAEAPKDGAQQDQPEASAPAGASASPTGAEIDATQTGLSTRKTSLKKGATLQKRSSSSEKRSIACTRRPWLRRTQWQGCRATRSLPRRA